MPIAQKKSPSDFMTQDALDSVSEDDLYDDDIEDTSSGTNHAIQSGWAAAAKIIEQPSPGQGGYVQDFRFTEEPQLVKFLDPDPFAVFLQHWVGFRSGKKSYVSPYNPANENSELKSDPLFEYLVRRRDANQTSAIQMPSKKIAMSLVNFSMEEPTQQALIVTASTVGEQLRRLNEDPKTGPLDKYFWSMSKTGTGTSSTYSILPVKPRDLEEDWGIDPKWADDTQASFVAQTARDIRPSTYDDLLEILDEVKSQDQSRDR